MAYDIVFHYDIERRAVFDEHGTEWATNKAISAWRNSDVKCNGTIMFERLADQFDGDEDALVAFYEAQA